MEKNAGVSHGQGSLVRDWIDPTRIYNPNIPAGRLAFLWGLAIYPLVVMFLLLTPIIIVMEATIPGADLPDYLGIVTWVFMLAWVVAAVCICLRRLKDLGRSQAWVWLAVVPLVNLVFFLYLLFKPGPIQGSRAG